MSYSYPLKIFSFFSWIFGHAHSVTDTVLLTEGEAIVGEGQTMQMRVPDHAISWNSLKIESKIENLSLSHWNGHHAKETFQLIRKAAHVWRNKGITDYLIYGKESPSIHFSYELVPYPKAGWSYWKQFKSLWNAIFGGIAIPEKQRANIVRDFKQSVTPPCQPPSEKTVSLQTDAFCNSEIIHNQQIFEGKCIRLLYDYKPIGIGKRKLHFLLVPKEHRAQFSDLTQEEYLEVMQFTQKLLRFYQEKEFKIVHFMNKNGVEAGQSVPHWHAHLVFVTSRTQELFGKLILLKKMLFGSSPLSKTELEKQISVLKTELVDVLSH